VLEGPIAQAIVALSRSRGARVIVIGTGGHATIGRHIFGERALQILSVADRPVLIVPSDTVAGPVPVAVVAVDFSPSSARAARAVFPMLAEQSHLHLVHVRTASSLKTEMLGWPDDAYEARCADLFRHFVRQLPALPSVTVETACVSGDAADSLVRYATTAQAGLIACGRLGHSLIERLFVRSVSAALVRRAPCPVLVIPEQPGDAAR
jgi:nucleotide-binding universal stress UspA family protein